MNQLVRETNEYKKLEKMIDFIDNSMQAEIAIAPGIHSALSGYKFIESSKVIKTKMTEILDYLSNYFIDTENITPKMFYSSMDDAYLEATKSCKPLIDRADYHDVFEDTLSRLKKKALDSLVREVKNK